MPDVQTAAVPVLDPATLRFPDRFTPQEVLDSLASAEAARDAAQDIADTLGGTPDGAVAALVDDPDSATRLALSSTFVTRVTVADLEAQPEPLVMLHGGHNLIAPENTMAWFDAAFSYGYGLMDGGDLRSMTGCTTDLAICHNPTVDFMTSSFGNVADHSPMSWRNLTVDSSAWFRQGWGDTAPCTARDLFAKYGNKTILFPEIKDAATSTTDPRPILLSLIREFRMEQSVVVCSFNRADLAQFVAAGIEVCWIASGTTISGVTPAELLADGIRWLQLQGSSWTNSPTTGVTADAVPDATISAMVAAGLNVLVWTLGRQFEVARYVALGVKGVVVTSPYAAADVTKYRRTTDPFVQNRQPAGTILTNFATDAKDDTTSDDARGVFASGRHKSVVIGGANNQWMLQGWSCPLPLENGYAIDADFVIDTPHSNTGKAFGMVVCCPDDKPWFNGAYGYGYELHVRQNGNVNIYRGTGAASTTSIASAVWTVLLTTPPVLSGALTAGAAITALPVTALPGAVPAGTRLLLPTTGAARPQVAVVSALASAGATSIAVNSITPNSTVATATELPQVIHLRAEVTATTVKLTRTDMNESVTATDAANRGRYWHTYKYGGGWGTIVVSYMNVAVTNL